MVALDLARREREAAFRRERSRAECSLFVGPWARLEGVKVPGAGRRELVPGVTTCGVGRLRAPARTSWDRGRGASIKSPRSPRRLAREPPPMPNRREPRAGEGTRKPQRQKTYTLRSDKSLRACRSDFDPRPLGNGDGPVLAAQRGLIRRAVALATVYIKVGRTTI